MWISELRAIAFASASVLKLPRPDSLRLAVNGVLPEAVPGLSRSQLDRTWERYEESRAQRRWTDHVELSLDTFLRDAAGSDDLRLASLEAAVAARFSASLEWFPDVLPALDYLRESGYRMALVLDLPLRLTPAWLERTRAWFDVILPSVELGVRSPAAACFTEVVRRLHGVPARVLHVGGGLAEDVHGAQRAGLRAALLERPLRSPPDPAALAWLRGHENLAPEAVRPDLKLRGLEELAAAIDASA